MNKIYVVDLESVPTRYTCQWKEYVPRMLEREAKNKGVDVSVINITGGDQIIDATPGAFLNFQQTNIYKNTQMNDIANRFTDEIEPGDKFLFTDAWHPGIIQLKYMSELLGIPVEIHSMWHAGSYDPQDFLGRLIKDKRWANNAEKSFFHASDYNWFATKFHVDMFIKNVFGQDLALSLTDREIEDKFCVTGWPMDYMYDELKKFRSEAKEDIILFPHRVAPEKQPEIFRDLAKSLPQFKFVICQDKQLSKDEYHTLLARSKLLFSANLQETLGISPYEGAMLNVRPYLPNRLSYSEMYPEDYLYPSEWTESFDKYLEHKSYIIEDIKRIMMNDRPINTTDLSMQLESKFFTATNLTNKLLEF
jgi:glycosyltransferase involved in cell wall biosynthesis